MRLLGGLSFHWGWFLRYKLSQPQNRTIRTSPVESPASLHPPPLSLSHSHALSGRRPLRDTRHTHHYRPQIAVVRVVSRCATGCREPHTYSADASPSLPAASPPPPPPPSPRRPPSSRSSIDPPSPRASPHPTVDQTLPGYSLNSNYRAVFETD